MYQYHYFTIPNQMKNVHISYKYMTQCSQTFQTIDVGLHKVIKREPCGK